MLAWNIVSYSFRLLEVFRPPMPHMVVGSIEYRMLTAKHSGLPILLIAPVV